MANRGDRLLTAAQRIHTARAQVNEAIALIGPHSVSAHNARVKLEELTHEGRALLDPLHSANRSTPPIITNTSKEYS